MLAHKDPQEQLQELISPHTPVAVLARVDFAVVPRDSLVPLMRAEVPPSGMLALLCALPLVAVMDALRSLSGATRP